jgi:solute carrier family 30 (zinc transporter), member 2
MSMEAQNKLLKVSVICVIFMIVELIGGYISNSVAIMSDAAHLLSDLLSFFVGIYSIRVAMRCKSIFIISHKIRNLENL